MTFDNPTTKEQMYEILKEIFNYYRLRRPEHDKVVLNPLVLEKMEFTPLTDEEIRLKAETLLYADQKREETEERNKLEEEIAEINQKILAAEQEAEENLSEAEEKYAGIIKGLNEDSADKGLLYSTVISDKIIEARKELSEEKQKINLKLLEKKATLTASLDNLNGRLNNLSAYFADIHEKEIEAKCAELKDEQDKQETEAFKYNNGISEKEQRYENTITQSQITLELRYLDLSSKEYTKSQLVDMGYYQDATDCVCAYYNTLSATEAYNDIKNESGLAIYLEDYYENIIFMYKNLATE